MCFLIISRFYMRALNKMHLLNPVDRASLSKPPGLSNSRPGGAKAEKHLAVTDSTSTIRFHTIFSVGFIVVAQSLKMRLAKPAAEVRVDAFGSNARTSGVGFFVFRRPQVTSPVPRNLSGFRVCNATFYFDRPTFHIGA